MRLPQCRKLCCTYKMTTRMVASTSVQAPLGKASFASSAGAASDGLSAVVRVFVAGTSSACLLIRLRAHRAAAARSLGFFALRDRKCPKPRGGLVGKHTTLSG